MTADVLAARRGDVGAYARLVESHASVVCAIATAIAGDVRLGEEISQEVFVAAWTGLPKLRNPAAFSTWLRQLARNRAKDALRRRSRRREDFDIGALERLADPGQPPGDSALVVSWASWEASSCWHRSPMPCLACRGSSFSLPMSD
ncbi:MAG: hypothetical protein KC912_21095 [Proteobacteria bacterium]|nr:hypothetical protein [Pseudomonadota bacterium]